MHLLVSRIGEFNAGVVSQRALADMLQCSERGVRDAVAVGIPDQRFGETICAVVEAVPGASPELSSLADHVKGHLAHYKAPRHLVLVDTIGRAPNGKVDYKRLKGVALDRLGIL